MKESREVVRAMATTAMQISNAMEDHQLSYFEMLQLVSIFGVWQAALKGIHTVPAELQDMTEADLEDFRHEALSVAKQFGIEIESGDTRWLADGVSEMVIGLIKVLKVTGRL